MAKILESEKIDLAPNGRIRVAINFGNPVLTQKDPTSGMPRGVSAELARELGKVTHLPIDFITFNGAGAVFDALANDVWDICFLAIDPVRSAGIKFTGPYVIIEGTYMVPSSSRLKSIEDVDRDGVRIAVAKGSAYDLYLSRTIKHAELVRAANPSASLEMFSSENLDVVAGVRQPLETFARVNSAVRVMDGRFMTIDQALGVPNSRKAAAAYLRKFIEEAKRSGFVRHALAESGQTEATVAPPQD